MGIGLGNVLITGAVYQVSGVITNVGNLDVGTLTASGYGEYDLTGGSIYIGSGGITTFKPLHYIEGPWVYKRNNLYYLVYASAGTKPEMIEYCTAVNPAGQPRSSGQTRAPGCRPASDSLAGSVVGQTLEQLGKGRAASATDCSRSSRLAEF